MYVRNEPVGKAVWSKAIMCETDRVNRAFGSVAMPFVAIWLGMFAASAPAADRVALVIGNAKYDNLTRLENPANDAQAMAEKLRSLDFELIGGKAHVDVTRNEMLDLLDDMEERLRPLKGATALVYYSGHGVAEGNDNWLVPVDDKRIQHRESVPDYAVAAWEGVVGRLEVRGDGLNIVILDACRDNPLPSRRKTRGSGTPGLAKGLARYQPATPATTVVVYAAAPGEAAYDGPPGGNSPFAAALLSEMEAPGRSLNEVLGATFEAVHRATGNVQTPWHESNAPNLPFQFVSASAQGGPSQTAQRHEPVKVALQSTSDGDVEPAAAHEDLKEQAARDLQYELEYDGEFQECPQCPPMVVVPAGTYEMGSPSGEGAIDEEGRHRVTIPEPIAIGMFEVRRAEFTHFMEETNRSGGSACWQYDGAQTRETGGSADPGFIQGENEPMVCVSWEDAQAYVEWLSTKTKGRYRLLSEAEWEYAARGGTVAPRYWDESESGQCGNANGADIALRTRYPDWFELTAPCDDGRPHTSEAGSYEPNAFGLYDMLGNAREWVADCWNGDYTGAPKDGSAWTESGNCALRVLRGGSWLDGPGGMRSSTRDKGTAGIRFSANGFRVARVLD